MVLGFLCNQFGVQELGSEVEIGSFCSSIYDVIFLMFVKVDVNGDVVYLLWKYLKGEKFGVLGIEGIKWNFIKFLVNW